MREDTAALRWGEGYWWSLQDQCVIVRWPVCVLRMFRVGQALKGARGGGG